MNLFKHKMFLKIKYIHNTKNSIPILSILCNLFGGILKAVAINFKEIFITLCIYSHFRNRYSLKMGFYPHKFFESFCFSYTILTGGQPLCLAKLGLIGLANANLEF